MFHRICQEVQGGSYKQIMNGTESFSGIQFDTENLVSKRNPKGQLRSVFQVRKELCKLIVFNYPS